jgi:hypothetical protein
LRLWFLIAIAAGSSACKASVSAEVGTQDKADAIDIDEPIDPSAAGRSGDEFDEQPPDYDLLGARHDLTLSGDTPEPTCSCLAVALGHPSQPSFFWQSVPANINPDAQLVIAFTSDGIACTNQDKDSLGASYWGYKRAGEDIVVVVENARFGRPITTGAIIPRPRGAGRVYVAPLDQRVPYARPLGGSGSRCEVPISGGKQGRVVPLRPAKDEASDY